MSCSSSPIPTTISAIITMALVAAASGAWLVWKLRDWIVPPKLQLREDEFFVVIAGCGFSGIAMGIELKAKGIPFVILEKAPSIGGTWWFNK